MKKGFLLLTFAIGSLAATAQKANVQSASNARKNKEFTEALEFISKAEADPSTKDAARTYFTKGLIYADMQNDPKLGAANPYREAGKAFVKSVELDPKLEKPTVDNALAMIVTAYYNDLVEAYNAKRYDDALGFANAMTDIYNLEGGKRFANNPSFDTVVTRGQLYAALGQYYDGKHEAAQPLLEKLKTNGIARSESIYMALISIYTKQAQEDKVMATIEEAKKIYPTSKSLELEELAYYTRTGKEEVFIKKLEDAVAKDPSNAIYLSNLAAAYNNIAFPKDANGKMLPAPANYEEMVDKTTVAYQNLMKVAPDNAVYSYNAGAYHFNRASNFISQMNNVKGNTAADKAKLDDLGKKADEAFTAAVGYFESAIKVLEPKLSTLNQDDRATLYDTYSALKTVYTRQNKMDKADEMKSKRDAMK